MTQGSMVDGESVIFNDLHSSSIDDTVIGFPMTQEVASDFDLKEGVVKKRVTDYMVRLIDDFKVHDYNLSDVGYYKIMTCIDPCGVRSVLPGLYRGRFVDAVAYAISQPEFYACDNQGKVIFDAGNSNNGYVEKVDFTSEDVIALRKRDFLK
jgi:hypothetical protein